MLNSSPSHTYIYSASANLPLIRRDWLANSGTILNVRNGSRNLCSILAILVAGVGCPSTRAKILVDLFSVWMKGYPSMPAWDVHAVSQAAEGIDPSITPCFT